jgi:hypothetical protein
VNGFASHDLAQQQDSDWSTGQKRRNALKTLARQTGQLGEPTEPTSEPEIRGKMQPQIIEKALAIARKRRGYLEQMRTAVQAGDREAVFEVAKLLTGMVDEERHRIDPRIN